MESMTQKAGRLGLQRGQDLSRLISASTRTLLPASPRRRERIATCAPLSSPVT